ncbi:MAG: hypothetical protein CMJ49_09060 [Planctomycetaceae bacterium]|nr:hypothetical protein [Planctomycetaceae bacterium]
MPDSSKPIDPDIPADPPRDRPSFLARPLTAALAAALLAVGLYASSTTYEFVYDDIQIINDTRLDSTAFALQLWTAPWWDQSTTLAVSRPLTTLTFWSQVQLHGRQPWAYHAVNVTLYAILSALIAWLAWTWLRQPLAAWIAGLLFAAHPIHVEAVANVVGRAEVLAALFIVTGIALWLRWRDHWTWPRAAVIGLCVLLAGLSKEHGYLLAIMLPLIELAQRRALGKPILARPWPWKPALMFLTVALIAGAQRAAISPGPMVDVDPSVAALDNPLVGADPDQRLATPFKLLGRATQLLAVPFNQSPDYSPRMLMPTDRWTDPSVLLGAAAIAAWLVSSWWCWRRRSILLGLWLCLPLAWAVPSNTLVLIGTIFGERLLFTLSIFLTLLAAALAASSQLALRTSRLAIATIAVLAFAGLTIQYSAVWRDNIELTGYITKWHPDSARFQAYRAELEVHSAAMLPDHDRLQQMQIGDERARFALKLWPRQSRAYNVLGEIARQQGDDVKARRYYAMAQRWTRGVDADHEMSPLIRDQPAYQYLVAHTAAIEAQLTSTPDDRHLKTQLAANYMMLTRYADAIALYEQLVTPDETNIDLLNAYLNTLSLTNDQQRALQICLQLMDLVPERWDLLTESAMLAIATQGATAQARQWIDRAIELNPDAPGPRAGLGMWYQANDQPDRAAAFRIALDLYDLDDPSRYEYQLRLAQTRDSDATDW